ncbi:hypothetical protein Cni_G03201 [Canna indica]|uniref:Uncharacterized protein n=1 Tax=Canna indica TaxID=4628 RepID=A0AAQ3JT45_9LILI|nr:hypothetical protein Cni_G03201 [Canna indica]
MGVLREGWWSCFCSGGGKSERVKGGIFASKGPSLAAISLVGGGGGGGWGGDAGGTGFLIHRNLLLTTHANLPTVAAAEVAEICLCHGRLPARLVPQRFFITSSILDLTIVGIDILDVDSSSHVQQPHYLKTCCNPSLELGTVVYLLGLTDKEELTIGEGKIVIATDNLIKLLTNGVPWCPGSAGFDIHGNLAFMVCDPMKLASSPTARYSASSSSSKSPKDIPMQFGIPIPVICDWLHQHWEGSLDEVSKPKLPLIRLLSNGHSENSGASVILRRVLKTTEENDDASSSLSVAQHSKYPGSCSSANGRISYDENPIVDLRLVHEQGIPTVEIFQTPESAKKRAHTSLQLSDANIPSKAATSIFLPLPLRQMLSDDVNVDNPRPENQSSENSQELTRAYHEVPPVGTWQSDLCSEVQSSASPLEMLEDGFESGVETMYSAETMESRNIPSTQNVGRSQSCVNYSRWNCSKQNSAARKAALQKQNTIVPVRKSSSQSLALPQRSHDYCSPTVSSSMKKRNSLEQTMRPRRNAVQVSPKWMF